MNENKIKNWLKGVSILLLLLSSALAVKAFKSVRREFSGIIVQKSEVQGFITSAYDLYVVPELPQNISSEENLFALLKIEPSRHGVSKIAFFRAGVGDFLQKQRWSIFVRINGERFTDNGVYWFILALVGIFVAIWSNPKDKELFKN
ncbi:MAG: hypothetical protein GX221_05075 [Candidatus Riflebacteria bacterium]|nr:hypothetical protein [Candidatus Riflebacteria bacterium]